MHAAVRILVPIFEPALLEHALVTLTSQSFAKRLAHAKKEAPVEAGAFNLVVIFSDWSFVAQ
jgi:hypothetical protein